MKEVNEYNIYIYIDIGRTRHILLELDLGAEIEILALQAFHVADGRAPEPPHHLQVGVQPISRHAVGAEEGALEVAGGQSRGGGVHPAVAGGGPDRTDEGESFRDGMRYRNFGRRRPTVVVVSVVPVRGGPVVAPSGTREHDRNGIHPPAARVPDGIHERDHVLVRPRRAGRQGDFRYRLESRIPNDPAFLAEARMVLGFFEVGSDAVDFLPPEEWYEYALQSLDVPQSLHNTATAQWSSFLVVVGEHVYDRERTREVPPPILLLLPHRHEGIDGPHHE